MTFKLVIDDRSIGWFDSEDGCINSYIGEFRGTPLEEQDFDLRVTEEMAAKDGSAVHIGSRYVWESEAAVKKAFALIKMALKQDRPMPAWAQQALNAGWKPPKGWKA